MSGTGINSIPVLLLIKSESVEILLSGNSHGIFFTVFVVVVPLFCPDVKDHADGQEIEVRHGQPDLQTSEQEKRRRYFPCRGRGLPAL